jgi:DnaJ-class molecular chaperone
MLESCYDKNGRIIDFYTIFNVPGDAGTEEIKTSFRSLIKRYHPDTSTVVPDHLNEKFNLIIRGYRILIDEDMRMEYDRLLFTGGKRDLRGSVIIPRKRIRYSATLGEMLKARLLPKGMKRKDILHNFGQDIEIVVTPFEARRGAVAYVELPARMICPLCRGSHSKEYAKCHVCKGVGRIHTTSQLEVRIPPYVDDSTYIDVDLLRAKPDKLTGFTLRSLRIKITVGE